MKLVASVPGLTNLWLVELVVWWNTQTNGNTRRHKRDHLDLATTFFVHTEILLHNIIVFYANSIMTNTLSKYVSLTSLSCVFHPSPVLSMSNECQPWTYIPVMPTLDFCHTCHNANLGLTYLLCQPWTYVILVISVIPVIIKGVVKPWALSSLCHNANPWTFSWELPSPWDQTLDFYVLQHLYDAKPWTFS